VNSVISQYSPETAISSAFPGEVRELRTSTGKTVDIHDPVFLTVLRTRRSHTRLLAELRKYSRDENGKTRKMDDHANGIPVSPNHLVK
jgi:hypothetical protein